MTEAATAMDAAPRRLRIAFVYDAVFPYQAGGAERRIAELAQRLAARHEIHLVSWRAWDGPADEPDGPVQRHGVGDSPALYGGDGKRTVREALDFAARLVPAVIRGRYDVIDCAATPYLPLYACAAAARLASTPLVSTWHEFWGEHWDEYLAHRPWVARVARRLEAGAVGLGRRQVAVSPFTAERLVDAGLDPDGIRVVGNGVSLAGYDEVPPSTVASDVIFVGRLIDDKRVDLLLSALARLAADGTRARCLIVGDGPERARLVAQAAALGVSGQVRFVGTVDETTRIALLRASKVFVLPSVREGFGIAVVEAQAAGLAPIVVRSPHNAATALIRDGVDGIVSAPRAAELASALGRLLTHPEHLARLRAGARRAARAWDWDQVAADMERVYLEVAGPASVRQAVAPRGLSWR